MSKWKKTACHLIDMVSVLPQGLFLNPERHKKREKGKINIYAEVKMTCSEHTSRAVFVYREMDQKFWIASVISVYLE